MVTIIDNIIIMIFHPCLPQNTFSKLLCSMVYIKYGQLLYILIFWNLTIFVSYISVNQVIRRFENIKKLHILLYPLENTARSNVWIIQEHWPLNLYLQIIGLLPQTFVQSDFYSLEYSFIWQNKTLLNK